MRRKKPLANTWTHYLSTFFSHFIRHPYAPLLVQIVVTRRCNLNCAYCTESDQNSPPVPTERLRATITKLQALKTFGLALTGGEPTLHPDLVELIRYASQRIRHVSIITNGYTLTKELIEKFNDAGLNRLQISLDGVEPSEVTRKVLRTTMEKLRLLSEHAAFDVNINAVLGSIPYEQTLEIIGSARALGLEATVQWLHDSRGRVLNPYNIGKREIRMLMKEAKKAKPFLYDKNVYQVGVEIDKPWKCRAGSRYLYIDEFSNAHFCAQSRQLWSCPVDDLTMDILEANFHVSKPCSRGCTLGCVRNVSQFDFFRKQ